LKPAWLRLNCLVPGVLAFATPVVALTANKGLAVLLLLLSVLVLVWRRPAHWRAVLPFAGLVGVLLAWGFLSSFWSFEPALSLSRAGRLAGLFVAGLVLCAAMPRLSDAERRYVFIGLSLGALVALGMSLTGRVLYSTGTGVSWRDNAAAQTYSLAYGPFSSVIAAMLAPVAGWFLADRKWFWSLGIALFAGGVIMMTGANTAIVAIVCATVVFLVALRVPRFVTLSLLVILPLLAISAPVLIRSMDLPAQFRVAKVGLPNSLAHRLAIWRFVQERIDERPYLGWGLYTSRVLPGGESNLRADAKYQDILTVGKRPKRKYVQALPLHPHNASFHLRLELGLPGLVLYGAIWLLLAAGLHRSSGGTVARAAGAAALVSVFITSQLSFSVWQSWWLSAEFMVAGLVVLLLAKGGASTATMA
jgi:O-antigen ligase